jgi:hypothetical protein
MATSVAVLRDHLDATLKSRIKDSDGVVSNYIAIYNNWTKITDAEVTAGVTVVDFAYPPGYINRYGTNDLDNPGTTDMTLAIQAAFDQRAAGGADPYGLNQIYRTTDSIVKDPLVKDMHFHCERGAIMQCDHLSHGLIWICQDENSPNNSISHWTINGPNTHLPAGGYVPVSTGAGIMMHRNEAPGTETIFVTQYNGFLQGVTIQGFLWGLNMMNVIGLHVYNSFFQFNQYGIQFDGGQTNGNHFACTHIRYNRLRGVNSTGRLVPSGFNATMNTFYGCLFESNIPYPFVSGGTPPTDSTSVYLNNSYDFVFVGCYDENHYASIYLTNSSKYHKFIAHRISGGAGREGRIILDGPGIYDNEFDIEVTAQNNAEVSIESNDTNQLYNRFRGSGLNFIGSSILANLDYSDVRPSLNYSPSFGVGLIRLPSQGYRENVADGTNPGQIDSIGGSAETLNITGVGELRIGNGLTANTTVATILGAKPNSFIKIHNNQSAFSFFLISDNSNIVLLNKRSVTLNKVGQELVLWVNGDLIITESGRNFSSQVVGSGTITGGATTQAVTFAGLGLFNEPNTSYKVSAWVESITGAPAAGSFTAYATAIATTGFTLNVPVAPGVGASVTFGFEAIRLDS